MILLTESNFPQGGSESDRYRRYSWQDFGDGSRGGADDEVVKSSFNNTLCGSAFALATANFQVVGMAPVTENVFLVGGVGLNGAARAHGTV